MPTTPESCAACRGNVGPGRSCYACGIKGPAGEGNQMCPRCLRFGPHECAGARQPEVTANQILDRLGLYAQECNDEFDMKQATYDRIRETDRVLVANALRMLEASERAGDDVERARDAMDRAALDHPHLSDGLGRLTREDLEFLARAAIAALPHVAKVVELEKEVAQLNTKWWDYEQNFILPVFKWADEMGIDLPALVREGGDNCVAKFFGALRGRISELERELDAERERLSAADEELESKGR